MRLRSVRRRQVGDLLAKICSCVAGATGVLALFWILASVVIRGVSAFNLALFTRLPTPPGVEGGGLANAIVGSLVITVLAAAIAVPIGLMAGIYLAEFNRRGAFSVVVRFVCNTLVGIPSIVVGVFVYGALVVTTGHFSGYAASCALAVIMLPIVVRTTEDVLVLVPDSLRESALALGAPRWKVTFQIVFRSARAGLITGILLATARVSGETAPLLFTALNSPFWPSLSLASPTANLPVTIFSYAMSPFADWNRLAWAAALLITLGVLAVNVVARAVFRTQRRGAHE